MNRQPLFPVRNAEIVARRRAGEWPSDIAQAMGISRNVVIGVCNRAGLASAEVDRSAAMAGKTPSGADHHKAKLTPADVAAIRARYQPRSRTNGMTALAHEYGVVPMTIYAVVKGLTWRQVA